MNAVKALIEKLKYGPHDSDMVDEFVQDLKSLAQAAEEELAGENIIEIFTKDGYPVITSTTLASGRYAIRRLPAEKKVRPWRVTVVEYGGYLICPEANCHAIQTCREGKTAHHCLECKVLFGEPRELPE